MLSIIIACYIVSLYSLKVFSLQKSGLMSKSSPQEVFKSFIEGIIGPYKPDDWQLLDGVIEISEYAKNSDVLKVGHYCKYLFFIVEGAVRSHIIVKGKPTVTHFFLSRSFFTDFTGMAVNQPSQIGFRATENSQIIQIPHLALLELYNKSHLLERIGRVMAERQFLMEFQLRRLLLTNNSKGIYDYLIKEQPDLFQHFSLKDIASFMGISPESLSRLRK
jgi:CRP-like cAMP-binding protein